MIFGVRRSPDEPLIKLRGISLWYGQNEVLRDVSLDISRGETVVIIGESGCGKTQLLKTLVALVEPSKGSVNFDGKEMHRLSERELTKQRLRFGFVFQMAALFDSLTVYENVAFALREHRRESEPTIARIVRDRLEQVGLSPDVMVRKPAELSGGMRKRVGLARALALDPEIVLYDEPTTGLDPIMSDVINELILRTRASRSVTSIVVTHDMKSAIKVASRVVMLYPARFLEKGESQIIYDGRPEGLESSPDPRVAQFVRGEAGDRMTGKM